MSWYRASDWGWWTRRKLADLGHAARLMVRLVGMLGVSLRLRRWRLVVDQVHFLGNHSLVIIAVFIPMLLMGGYVGLFVREFVVTLVVAILISLVVSLTTVPMMCAYLLKPSGPVQISPRFFQWSDALFNRLLNAYKRSLSWALNHAALTMGGLLLTVCINVFLYTVIAKSFFPAQDTGQLTGRIQADQSVSFQAMEKKLARFIDIIKADPTENASDYHEVVQAARCPILVRGGGKKPIETVFAEAAAYLAQGAHGLVYGRNIYQHPNPARIVAAPVALKRH